MSDNLTAFQYAYMGLEAMEEPLVQALEIQPGVEEMSGKCADCGTTYTRRRTVLAGVRAYIRGDVHPKTASEERSAEWKKLSGLRQDLFHGLDDAAALENRAPQAPTAAMHYLHDAINCCSHAHDLESDEFALARKGVGQVIIGGFTADGLGPIEAWRPLRGTEEPEWVEEGQRGLVPEFRINDPGIPDLRVGFFRLHGGLMNATQANLEPVRYKQMPGA